MNAIKSNFIRISLIIMLLISVTTKQSQAIDRDQSKKIELFIRHLLQVDESRNIKEYAQFYAPSVVSNGEAMSKSEYMATIKNTYKKWPLCSWMLIDKPLIKSSAEGNRFEVQFRASYSAKNPSLSKSTSGKVLSKIVIIKGENDMPVISLIDLKPYDTFTYNEEKENDRSSRPLREILFDANNRTSSKPHHPNLEGQSPNVQKAYNNAFNTIDEMIKIASSPEYMEEWNRIKTQAYYHYINKGLTPKQAERAAEEYAGSELAKKHW